ncbi:MAG: BtrH N-terminal domain-containing protein [Desulfuromonadaceae bacterium]|nr:BtrH N-terminal domain-containing protein [Desulfuromonadaceae bacterium]
MNIDFPHRQFAHCESGVTANLLNFHGLPCSEALVFGIGAGLFFGYVPFIKLNFLPLTTFRTGPGSIFKKATRRLGIEVGKQTFRNPLAAENEVDRLLAAGCPVGAQTGVFWLPYFPPAFRFHFNGHNLVIFGKEGDDYLISDPIFEQPVRCPAADLRKARFAKGALAPRGKIYYIEKMPQQFDLPHAVEAGIRDVCRVMLKTPVPLAGVRGIRLLARQMVKWPAKLGEKKTILQLGHIIRMQEEIGTGGGGFRFIYAAFLQEAAGVLENDKLVTLSQRCTEVGDLWRDFALIASRVCKGRAAVQASFDDLAKLLHQCASQEERLFNALQAALGR